ncbi:MAG: hypothetical protein AB1782_18675 [Cyanobacteriota bacterium]
MTVLNWKIKVDIKKTLEVYKSISVINCECIYCQNYLQACDLYEPEIKKLFDNLGVDVKKSPEIYTMNQGEDGRHFYGGWYHFIGEIIDGEKELKSYQTFSKDFQIAFTETIYMKNDQFTDPIVQLEFVGYLPWVLDAKPEI